MSMPISLNIRTNAKVFLLLIAGVTLTYHLKQSQLPAGLLQTNCEDAELHHLAKVNIL